MITSRTVEKLPYAYICVVRDVLPFEKHKYFTLEYTKTKIKTRKRICVCERERERGRRGVLS